jgi:hypothetical protein
MMAARFGLARAELVLAVLGLGVLGLAVCGLGGCRGDAGLGPADSFIVYAPVHDAAGGPVRSPGGFELVEAVAPDDPRAEPLYKQLAIGFPAEVLRTDYLAKQLVREAAGGEHPYGGSAHAAAAEPTVFVVGSGQGTGGPRRGLATKGGFGRISEHPELLWIGLPAYPDHDRALPQTLAGLLGATAATRVSAEGGPPGDPLVKGYAQALEVVAREWRLGEGPAGAVLPDAGTAAQRALFAGVRENHYAVGADGAPRPAGELLRDPGLVATVLYRLAQSKSVGRKVAPPEVYAPFVKDRVPPGVSPAAVLGPFRNFQAKLLSAWGHAVLEGRPPRDIVDLVEAYGRALPAERLEVVRVFVITTYGATVKAGGVRPAAEKPGEALAQLTALAAEVAAGKLSPRAALPGPPPSPYAP